MNIRQRPAISKIDQLKVFAQGLGLNPDQIIMSGALAEPHRAIVTPGDLEAWQVQTLSSALKETLKNEIISELSFGSKGIWLEEWARRDSNP